MIYFQYLIPDKFTSSMEHNLNFMFCEFIGEKHVKRNQSIEISFYCCVCVRAFKAGIGNQKAINFVHTNNEWHTLIATNERVLFGRPIYTTVKSFTNCTRTYIYIKSLDITL